MSWQKTKFPSVYVRHQAGCAARAGGRCRCAPSYYAQARSKATKKIVKSRVVHDINEAHGWLVDFKRGRHAETTTTGTPFGELFDQWMDDAERGLISPKRSGGAYSPLTLRAYRQAFESNLRPYVGEVPADRLGVTDWQTHVDRLHRQGLATNTIVSILIPVRSVYRWACSPRRRILEVNATTGLELPPPDERARDRIAAPTEAATLLAALHAPYRTAFALAFYTGMRRREIIPCLWEWVDFDAGVIHVRESKTKSGIRKVPMAGPLRAILLEERMRQGNPDETCHVVPSPRHGGQISGTAILDNAYTAWDDAKLKRIGLHDCRHTYASFMIAAMAEAGKFNPKALSQYMGHASIQETYDRYGHLFPGNEAEAATLLDAYLKGATG